MKKYSLMKLLWILTIAAAQGWFKYNNSLICIIQSLYFYYSFDFNKHDKNNMLLFAWPHTENSVATLILYSIFMTIIKLWSWPPKFVVLYHHNLMEQLLVTKYHFYWWRQEYTMDHNLSTHRYYILEVTKRDVVE